MTFKEFLNFEASEREGMFHSPLYNVQVKSLRLPKRPGGHRGFAFVEYVTKQGAEKALKALSSTHLYGRHLVTPWNFIFIHIHGFSCAICCVV